MTALSALLIMMAIYIIIITPVMILPKARRRFKVIDHVNISGDGRFSHDHPLCTMTLYVGGGSCDGDGSVVVVVVSSP